MNTEEAVAYFKYRLQNVSEGACYIRKPGMRWGEVDDWMEGELEKLITTAVKQALGKVRDELAGIYSAGFLGREHVLKVLDTALAELKEVE